MSRAVVNLPKSAPRPGEFISGAYRVEHSLGSGGMGYVLAVTRLADSARLAIKMLNPDLSQDPRIVSRFLREARAAQSVTNEHGCRVLDVGTLPTGTPYLVMERLQGTDLASLLEREGSVPFVQAVDWILQASEALAQAHANRYVHRDLKPSNLFLASVDDRVLIKVLDFGIAKSLDMPKHSKLTTTSAVLGSPSYMSPEQLTGSKDVDERSDIWSLGVVLYELMAGVVPFDAETLPELSVLILTGKPMALTARGLGVPRALSNVVGACLRRDPSTRFGNLAELAVHLIPFASELGRESANRVSAVLGLPSTRIVIGSEEELATTMQAPRQSFASHPSQSAHVSPSGAAVSAPDPQTTHGDVKRRAFAIVAAIATVATLATAGAFTLRAFRGVPSATSATAAAPEISPAASEPAGTVAATDGSTSVEPPVVAVTALPSVASAPPPAALSPSSSVRASSSSARPSRPSSAAASAVPSRSPPAARTLFSGEN